MVTEPENLPGVDYELILEARRRPELAPAVQALYDRYLDATRRELERIGLADDPALARLVFAALDGLVLQMLVYGRVARTPTRRSPACTSCSPIACRGGEIASGRMRALRFVAGIAAAPRCCGCSRDTGWSTTTPSTRSSGAGRSRPGARPDLDVAGRADAAPARRPRRGAARAAEQRRLRRCRGRRPSTVVLVAELRRARAARLGRLRARARWFGTWAGVAAALIVVTRVPVLDFGARAYVDIPFIALVLGALLVETRRPRAGAPVLAAPRRRWAAAPRGVAVLRSSTSRGWLGRRAGSHPVALSRCVGAGRLDAPRPR